MQLSLMKVSVLSGFVGYAWISHRQHRCCIPKIGVIGVRNKLRQQPMYSWPGTDASTGFVGCAQTRPHRQVGRKSRPQVDIHVQLFLPQQFAALHQPIQPQSGLVFTEPKLLTHILIGDEDVVVEEVTDLRPQLRLGVLRRNGGVARFGEAHLLRHLLKQLVVGPETDGTRINILTRYLALPRQRLLVETGREPKPTDARHPEAGTVGQLTHH